MTEPRPKTPEEYAREYKYAQAMLHHSEDFDALVASVPEDQAPVREAMRGLYHVQPDKLLDPDKLSKLKKENPALFGQVSTYYGDFLKKMLGLE
jgi:hypothetical protein